ncbi:MAG: hypothetical protein CFH22_01048 [Alphaproteobacteria bacterium MarineAlpha5_Bin12]|nr:hypothetical protein [Pelagibacteraceae bacterium]PPR41126.1 MAG: hypothetical protein CFH22_01048 [Alphaproteobacteria bacterium MarineAlpha5_Bin12]|tara:strand:- start:4786 stop:4986 length:201 start_codon:yes stop_codon:yes gene_type:complete
MEKLKLILERINNDLSSLEEAISKKNIISQAKNASDYKKIDKKTYDQISYNLDKLDEIIKKIDENY